MPPAPRTFFSKLILKQINTWMTCLGTPMISAVTPNQVKLWKKKRTVHLEESRTVVG